MWNYRRHVERDLERWTSAGWVTAGGAAKIREDLTKPPGMGLAGVLGILASVLLAFGIFSFVAAHWDEMSRLVRLGLLFALLWAGYAVAGVLFARGMRAFGDAAVLFAVSVFGASIMLISQMFHIDGNPPDGVYLWWIGALTAGVLLRSNPALALAMVLVCVWTGMEMGQRQSVYWPFLIGWAAVSVAFLWQRWRPGAHLSGMALSLFVISLDYVLNKGHEHQLVLGLGLAAAIAAIAAERSGKDWSGLAPVALGYAIATAFAGLMAMQFYESPSRDTLIGLAAVTLALLLAAIWYGQQTRNRGLLWLGYIGFSIETLAIYYNFVGTMLSTSMFFLSAGLIVAALALVALRLHKRASAAEVMS